MTTSSKHDEADLAATLPVESQEQIKALVQQLASE